MNYINSLKLACCLTLGLPAAPALAEWPRVPDEQLAELRGGFVTSDGMLLNFSLGNIVSVDGQVVLESMLSVQDLLGSGGLSVQQWHSADGTLISSDALRTVIQNGVDGRLLQNMRLVDIELSSPGGIVNLGQQLESGVIGTLR